VADVVSSGHAGRYRKISYLTKSLEILLELSNLWLDQTPFHLLLLLVKTANFILTPTNIVSIRDQQENIHLA
jgi:hypothetical protein